MKNFKLISIIFLVICLSVSVFSGCKGNGNSETTTTTAASNTTESTSDSTKEVTTGTTVFSDENYTYHSVVYQTEKSTDKSGDEYTYAVIPTTKFVPVTIVTTPKTTRIETTSTTAKQTEKHETTTEKQSHVSTEPIKEISKGIGVLTKTTPIMPGNTATITVLGNPKESYTIEFYEDGSTPSNDSGLKTKKANDSGFVSWTFTISRECTPGEKKIIIKEIGTENYIQTSITVK